MFIDSLSMLSIEQPISFIEISFGRFPYSKPIFGSILPLSLKNLPIIPLKTAIAFSYSIDKLPFVNSINVSLASICFFIIFILSLEHLPLCDHETLAMSFIFDELTEKDTFIGWYNFEVIFSN